MADVSDEPMTHLEVYRLVEEHGNRVAKAVVAALAAHNGKAVLAPGSDLVTPVGLKRITRDSAGNIEFIEELRPVAHRGTSPPAG